MAANAPTTITDNLLRGGDFTVFTAFQTTKGQTNPSTAWDYVRRSEGVARTNKNYGEGIEIPQDRQAIQQVEGSDEHVAEISCGLTKQSVAYLVAAICGGAETLESDTGTTYAATASGFTGGSGDFTNYQVGDVIFFTGFATAGLNRGYVITAKADNQTITTSPTPEATESAGASVTASSNINYSGKTPTLLQAQTRAPDTTKAGNIDYQTFYDGLINTAGFEVTESGAFTSNLNVQFANKVDGTAALPSQTDNAITVDSELSASGDVVEFFVNNAKDQCTVKSLTLEFSNNSQTDEAAACTRRYELGQITATGQVVVRAPVSSPFTWRDYYLNATDVTLGVMLDHGNGDYSYIAIDKTKITGHNQSNAGNTIANHEADFTAQKDETLGTTVRVYRNWV